MRALTADQESGLRAAVYSAVVGVLRLWPDAPPEVVGRLCLQAFDQALRYHAQRQGVEVSAETAEITDERPDGP